MAEQLEPASALDDVQLAEIEKLRERAVELERFILQAVRVSQSATWEAAEALYAFHEEGLWRLAGYDTLEEFLAQPELSMSRTQFFRLTKMWRDLVIVREVPASGLRKLDPMKVSEVVPAIMRGADVDEALSDAEVLGARDLRTRYRPAKEADAQQRERDRHLASTNGDLEDAPPAPGPLPDDVFDAEAEPVRVKCAACGQWYTPEDEDES